MLSLLGIWLLGICFCARRTGNGQNGGETLDLEAVIRRRLGGGGGVGQSAERGGNGEGGDEFHVKASGDI